MKLDQSGHRLLDHVTDAFVEAWGPTLEEAFEESGKALFETMIDPTTVKIRVSESIVANGHDEMELLYDWLEKLLLVFEIGQVVLGDFNVMKIEKSSRDGWELTATVSGEKYDPDRHGRKIEVKGVTYHQMSVGAEKQGSVVRFLLDL